MRIKIMIYHRGTGKEVMSWTDDIAEELKPTLIVSAFATVLKSEFAARVMRADAEEDPEKQSTTS